MESDDSGSSNVTVFPAALDRTTPNMALLEAMERGLDAVLIIGGIGDGTIYIRSSANVSNKDALWMAEQARLNALGLFGDDDE